MRLGWNFITYPELGAVGPVGPDLGGGDVAPVAVEPLAHVHVEVHAACQVSLVLQQPHLCPAGDRTTYL